MVVNEGSVDRVLRAFFGLASIGAGFVAFKPLEGQLLGIALVAVGAVLLVTGLVGFCPAYRLIGLRTCRTK
jgi:hypothetical protein